MNRKIKMLLTRALALALVAGVVDTAVAQKRVPREAAAAANASRASFRLEREGRDVRSMRTNEAAFVDEEEANPEIALIKLLQSLDAQTNTVAGMFTFMLSEQGADLEQRISRVYNFSAEEFITENPVLINLITKYFKRVHYVLYKSNANDMMYNIIPMVFEAANARNPLALNLLVNYPEFQARVQKYADQALKLKGAPGKVRLLDASTKQLVAGGLRNMAPGEEQEESMYARLLARAGSRFPSSPLVRAASSDSFGSAEGDGSSVDDRLVDYRPEGGSPTRRPAFPAAVPVVLDRDRDEEMARARLTAQREFAQARSDVGDGELASRSAIFEEARSGYDDIDGLMRASHADAVRNERDRLAAAVPKPAPTMLPHAAAMAPAGVVSAVITVGTGTEMLSYDIATAAGLKKFFDDGKLPVTLYNKIEGAKFGASEKEAIRAAVNQLFDGSQITERVKKSIISRLI